MDGKPSAYREYYETRYWAGRLTLEEKIRFDSIGAHMPGPIRTLLEVGCGDGRLSIHLPDAGRMAFADLSHSALVQFRIVGAFRIQAFAGLLPFSNRSFDLVVCSEVLEHLDDAELDAARLEIARVSARWVLITVPYQEQLRAEAYRCGKCRAVFHAYGHMRSIPRSFMLDLMPGFRALNIWTFGKLRAWPQALAALRTPRIGSHCPKCQNDSKPESLSIPQKVVDWINTHSGYRRDYWIGAVYERAETTK